MVSYIRVHITPEKYKGRQTDQSQEPVMADHPSSAPQLKVNPEQNRQLKRNVQWYEHSWSRSMSAYLIWSGRNSFSFSLCTQDKLRPVGESLHQRVGDYKRQGRRSESYAERKDIEGLRSYSIFLDSGQSALHIHRHSYTHTYIHTFIHQCSVNHARD